MGMASPRLTGATATDETTGGLLRILGIAYLFATPLDFVPSPVGTPASILGLVFLTQWLVALGSGHPAIPAKSLAVPLTWALAIWSAITSIWSVNPKESLTQALSVALLGLSAVAIAGTFRSNVRLPAWALMLGAGVAAMAALLSAPGRSGRYVAGGEQATFLGVDPNALAFHLCLGLAASFFLIVSETQLTRRAIPFVLALLLTAAILVVGSRTGGGALVISTLLFVALSTKSVRAALVGGVLLLTLVWLFRSLTDSGALPARLEVWYRAPVLTDNRESIIEQYWELRDEWILRGVGAGADADYLYVNSNWYKNAHSAFWKTWVELGVLGLTLWFGILINLVYRVVKSPDRLLFILVAPTIIAFFYTLGPLNSNMLWALIGLVLGTSYTPTKSK